MFMFTVKFDINAHLHGKVKRKRNETQNPIPQQNEIESFKTMNAGKLQQISVSNKVLHLK